MQFYQKALGNCYGLKLPEFLLQVKNKFTVFFIIIFGTISFPIYSVRCHNTPQQRCKHCVRANAQRTQYPPSLKLTTTAMLNAGSQRTN